MLSKIGIHSIPLQHFINRFYLSKKSWKCSTIELNFYNQSLFTIPDLIIDLLNILVGKYKSNRDIDAVSSIV
jgi:hypothetical protein